MSTTRFDAPLDVLIMFIDGFFTFRGMVTFILYSPSGKGLFLIAIFVEEIEVLPDDYLDGGKKP
jgi:hypothetical protein